MKKRFAVCTFSLCILALVSSAVSVSAANGYIRGDTNGDGVVSIKDVTVIQRCLAELESDSTGMVAKSGNISGSNLDISDATLIQLYLAECGNPYHIGECVEEATQPTTKSYDLPFIPVNG